MTQVTPQLSEQTEYVKFWNDTLANKFDRFRHILMEGLSHHSDVPLERLRVAPGSRILDVGCGWGDTAMILAHKTGPEGYVLGVDCVDQFLQKARADAAEAGLHHIDFVAGDVERYPFEQTFDLCFSRFGMMFFEQPVWAMRNVRKALRPSGELMFIVWRDIADNPGLGLAKSVVLEFLPPPGDGARTCGPGPFSMSSRDVVSQQLEIAGFQELNFERIDGPITIGASLDDAVAFQLALGPAGEVYREAGETAQARHAEIEQALREALKPYQKDDGSVVTPSSSWCITAKSSPDP